MAVLDNFLFLSMREMQRLWTGDMSSIPTQCGHTAEKLVCCQCVCVCVVLCTYKNCLALTQIQQIPEDSL